MSRRARPLSPTRSPPAVAAWLAILALLINAVWPAALASGGEAQAGAAVAGFCGGSAPGGKSPAMPARHHCPLCLAAASGFAPATPVRLVPPRIIGSAAPAALPAATAVPHLPFAAAQPRGPPPMTA